MLLHLVGRSHGDQIERLIQKARCGRAVDVIDGLAHPEQKFIGQPLERPLATKKWSRSTYRTSRRAGAEASRDLENRLRETVVDAQFVGAGVS
ncbi:MAG: hypothetical protein WDN50_07640 [Bradyrhizobium sp.]